MELKYLEQAKALGITEEEYRQMVEKAKQNPSELQQIKKQQADLVFQLMMGGVI